MGINLETKHSNIEIAKTILEAADAKKEGLHVNDIADHAIFSGIANGISKEELAKKLAASLATNVKRKDSLFTKVKNASGGEKRGVYRLKKSRPQQVELPIPEPEQSGDTGFVGRGGEYAVMSELLFRDFNVSLMSVDKGVDVVAANAHGKYFHIQVKTSNNKDGVFSFGIRRKSFEANHSGQTFYIFVMRREKGCDFVVMPNSQIVNYIALGVIKGVDTLSLRITYDGKARKYSMNGGHDITIFVNRWGQIC